MQAVQAIGSLRPQRRRRSKHVVTMAIFKKLLLPLLLVLTVMFAVFLPTGADVTDNIVMSVNASSQTAQSAAHTLYSVAATTRDSNDGGQTKVDMSNFYVDAAEVVPDIQPLLQNTRTGLKVALNSPTQEYTDNAFVVNIEQIVALEMQDIIDVETRLGIGGHASAEEYARKSLTSGFYMPVSDYSDKTTGSGSVLRGATGPALLDRLFYENDQWLVECGSGGASHNTRFWDNYGYHSDETKMDIMLVATSDVDRYYAGENVDVYYVEYNIVDYKAHTAPWGVGQTYIHFSPDKKFSNTTSSSGGSSISVDRDGTRVDTLLSLYDAIKTSGANQYWLPTLEYNSTAYGFTPGFTHLAATSPTGGFLEVGPNDAYEEFVELFGSGYSVIGILTYAA